jgi:acetyl-CoA/propionyl-CoA carboxylase biotin carboxyl carrier protein
MPPLESVLVANRGEIAVRIIRAAKEMGIRAIAVYSDLDRDSLHTSLADEAWNIGPAPSADSYLNVGAILAAARSSGAAAIHPGYGFLSENAAFARAVIGAGLIWVGPPPEAMVALGDKMASRRVAEQAGVPGVPGTLEPLRSAADARTVADVYGFPIVVKAAHGGGGRGLRVVSESADLERAFEAARREADAYFASPEVYVERYLERPRHIEAQVMFDRHGNGFFLGERDCSLQRRHQKLIEEAPSPALSDRQRKALGRAALAVAGQAGYQSAGTVEFLLDEGGHFYFLEMNTRLQVEHTITEVVTGIDIVREQFRVASGEKLDLDPISSRGHAIEFRVNAEDPSRGFLPCPGTIEEYREPGGFGIRVDGGYRAGAVISPYYDDLIAKLVVWGRDRDEAISRSRRAIGEFLISGVPTTLPFHRLALDTPSFLAGHHHTQTVEQDMDLSQLAPTATPSSVWERVEAGRSMTVEVGGRRFEVKAWGLDPTAGEVPGGRPARRRPVPQKQVPEAIDHGGAVTAPMQGTIVKVHVGIGDSVMVEQPLFVLEAMKMENEIRSPLSGSVLALRVGEGTKVSPGEVLATIR